MGVTRPCPGNGESRKCQGQEVEERRVTEYRCKIRSLENVRKEHVFSDQNPGTNIAFSVMKYETHITFVGLIHEEIKSRSNYGSICNRSVQNVLSSRLLSENLKIKIYRTVVSYVCETWPMALR